MPRSKDSNIRHIQPRDYQVELVERAKLQNTIISIGTGAGKTFVAVLLIKEYSHRIIQNNEKIVFLVNTVPLVEQQANHIKFHSSLKVACILGGLNKRTKYEKTEMDKLLQEHHVIVITAQIFLDLLNHGLFDLQYVALLIVDECHHCLGELHPYRLILNFYKKVTGTKPRILGLTASVLNKKVSLARIEYTIQKLESIMNSTVETASDYTSICKYATKPKQFIICTKDDNDNNNEKFVVELLNRFRTFVENNDDFQCGLEVDLRKPVLEAFSRVTAILQQVGSWCALKSCLLWQKKLLKLKDTPILGKKPCCILRMAETTFRTCSKVLSQKINSINTFEKLIDPDKIFITDRIRKLLEILKNYSPLQRDKNSIKDQLSGIIFVNERFTAFMINTLIKYVMKLDPGHYGYIKVDFLVGHTGNSETENEDRRLANKKQELTLHKFRNGQLNLLVATNVLEEGIDIKNCNLVIRYDKPMDFRSYLQSCGRARKENSAFYILVQEKNYVNFMADLTAYSQTQEFILKRYRSGNEYFLDKEIERHMDEIIPPYIVESSTGKSQVMLSGAIQLVNKYCAKLPSDVFTRLLPHYTINSIKDKDAQILYKAELILPINSPVKETITTNQPYTSKTIALMATFLEACKKLHQRKELNDQLLPTGKEIIADLLGELDDEEYLPYLSNKAGSSKRSRLYDRKMSKILSLILPKVEEETYIYIIEMKLIKPITDEKNPKKRKIIDPYEINRAFGFLSSKELPIIPGFSVFQRQGEMMVRIRKTSGTIRTNFELYQLICLFHQHVFEDILRIARGGIEFSPKHSPIPLFIVPLKRVGPTDLDYTLDESYLRWDIRDTPSIPSDDLRKNFIFDEQRYTDAVVMPWYRSEDQCAYYFVAEILRDQTPSSAFPDTKFTCFNEYFKNKYHLEIFNQQQFLLDVDHTSARMNLLLPRTSTGRSVRRPLDPSQRQILVPELVHIHPLTASLWTMIVALPTVLYRLNSLSLADEFRAKVLQDALKVNIQPQNDFEWTPLTYHTQNSDEEIRQIKNLEQLKRINKEEKNRLNDKEIQLEEPFDVVMNEEIREDDLAAKATFEIGVWDPSDGINFKRDQTNPDGLPNVVSNTLNRIIPKNGFKMNSVIDEEISEMLAIGTDTTIHNYEDISDDEEMDYHNFKFLMHNKVTSVELGDVECMDVHVDGWNEDADLTCNNIEIDNENLPLTISCNNPHINIVNLMNDLERNYGGLGTTEVSNKNKVFDISNNSTSSRKKLNVDSTQALGEVEQRERTKKDEEILSEEIFQLEEKEKITEFEDKLQTKRPDYLENFDNALMEKQEFRVWAPELKWMSFTFMTNFTKQNPWGVSPSLLLQALTTSSAADGINLERLETIGDSFLKMAVTNYLYHMHQEQHEGKLSFARSKEVSNSRLFILGRQKGIPLLMETLKFDPHVNWLPPCYVSTSEFHAINPLDYTDLEGHNDSELSIEQLKEQDLKETGWGTLDDKQHYKCENGFETITFTTQNNTEIPDLPPMPYNMLTQQSINDKSVADAVEALIGAHLIQLGQEPALKFMNWMGIKVLTEKPILQSPLLRFVDTQDNPHRSLRLLMLLYNKFNFSTIESTIEYNFGNKAYLVQAFTHASYFENRVTGCYQRLEFLGDAILDYMITRFLFEHKKQYSPGVLTDLRSALVNNTIFASMAVKYNFHKHFIAMCPPLYQMIEKFVNFCKQKDFAHCANFDDEIFMVTEDEIDEGHEEDVEVPKAMGDIFESLAGAVYLDCGMNLDIVWQVFYNMMRDVIEKCCTNPPQSPVRELFERKNSHASFRKIDRNNETGKVRVTVDVDGIPFTGMGRSYRIAKCTAAKRALQYLKKLDKERSKKEKDKVAAQTMATASIHNIQQSLCVP